MTLLLKSFLALLCLLALINAQGGKGKGKGEEASSSNGPPPWAPASVGLRKKANPGFSLRFNGVNDFVEIPEIRIGGPLSFEFSILPRSGASITPFMYFADNSGRNSIELAYDPSTRAILLILTDGQQERSRTTTTSHPLTLDFWNYYGITIDNQGNVKIYKEAANGNMEDVSTNPVGRYVPVYSVRKVAFLGRNIQGSSFFHGDLDNILIWTSVLRRQDFVRDRSVEEASPSLIAWWDLDQGSGLQALDFSTNHRHGVLGGGSLVFAPRWIYSANVPKKSCTFWHSLFSLTFDNRLLWHEIWRLTGEFWLVRSNPDSNGFSDIAIQVALEESKKIPISSVTGFGLKVFSDAIVFDLDFTDKIDSVLSINGEVVSDSNILLPEHSVTLTKTFQGNKGDHRWKIDIPNLFEVEIRARPRFDFVELKMSVPRYWSNSTSPLLSGICGDYNGNAGNDNINTLWPVDEQDSFFIPHEYEPIPEDLPDYTCDINQTTPEFQAKARLICEDPDLILPALRDACLTTICTAGSFDAAIDLAQVTFENCIDEFIAFYDGLPEEEDQINPCKVPCPNFCSLNGECVDGECICNDDWVGADCSQQESFPCFKATWPSGEEYVLEPFRGFSSVVQHYSYSSPNWWSSNTGLEISRSSVLYLYEQVIPGTAVEPPQSHLSLVILNGKANDGFGGKIDLVGDITMDPAFLADLEILVADGGGDSLTLSGNSLEAKWVWWRCCGDGLALGPLPSGNPFCISLNYTQSVNLDQIVVSNQNQFGAQDLFGVDTDVTASASLSICGNNCTAACAFHTDCASCTEDPQCGWCQESELCSLGTARGPRDGYCSFWRFSTEPDTSRVLKTSLAYPVQPSTIKVVLGSDELAADFTVTVPHPEAAALDVVMLQDLTSSFGNDLQVIKSLTSSLFESLREVFPWMRMGLSSFTDFPVAPYGSNSAGDYAYKTRLGLTAYRPTLLDALQNMVTAQGGDELNAQLEALRACAEDESLGWRTTATRVVVMVTKSAFHSGGMYPMPDELRTVLLEKNVVPIFITPQSVHAEYQSLVNTLGFGSAHVASSVAAGSIFSEVTSALNEVLSTVQVVPLETGTLDRWAPAAGYRGLSPLTRVTFNVFLQGASSSATKTVLVVPGFGRVDISEIASDLPVAIPCVDVTVDSDSEVLLSLRGTSFYPDPIVPVITSLPSSGVLYQWEDGARGAVIEEGSEVTDLEGRVLFVPADSSNDETFFIGFKLKDSCAGCSPVSECRVSVRGVAAPPVGSAVPPELRINESTSGDIELRSSTPATFIIISAPAKGQLLRTSDQSVIVSGGEVEDGRVTYVPIPFEFGLPYTNFQWQAKAPNGLKTDPVFYNIFVDPVNDPPIAHPTSISVNESSSKTFTLTASQTYGENDVLTFSVASPPNNGDVVISPNGQATFTPTPRFRGETTFTFRVTDAGGLFDTALVTINVLPVPRVPTANNVVVSTPENQRVNFTLEASEDDGRALQAFISSWEGPGTLFQADGSVVPKFQPNVEVSFSLGYLPPSYQHSPPSPFASFNFFVRSEVGLESDLASVSITVDDVPFFPETLPTAPVHVAQGESTVITLRARDYDVGDNVRFFICDAPEGQLLSQSTPLVDGSEITPVTFSNSSEFVRRVQVTYAAPISSEGDSFSFRVESAQDVTECQTVSINVTEGEFPPPVATIPDPLPRGDEDGEVVIVLAGTDENNFLPLTFHLTSLPCPDCGRIFEDATNVEIVEPREVPSTLRYVPAPESFGNPQAVIEFSVKNSRDVFSESVEVPIIIDEVIRAPTASDASFTLDQRTFRVVQLNAVDRKFPLSELTFSIESPVSNGQLLACDDAECETPSAISSPLPSRWVRYTPTDTFFGEDSFTFNASNPSLTSSPAVISFTVNRVNRAPTANAIGLELNELESRLITLEGSDPDGDDLTYRIVNNNFLGTLFQVNSAGDAQASFTQENELVEDSQGRVRYTAGFNPSAISPYALITYEVSDPDGASATATIEILVARIDTPPETLLPVAEGDANSLFTITLGATDNSPNGPHTFAFNIVDVPTRGILYQFNSSDVITSGAEVLDSSGRVQYRGDGIEWGRPYSNFTFTATNVVTTLTSAPRFVDITVNPIAVAPVLGMVPPVVNESSSITFELGILNLDELHPEAVLTYYITNNPFGTLFQVDLDGNPTDEALDPALLPTFVTNPNGLIHYVPSPGFSGLTEIGYFVNESIGGLPCCANIFQLRHLNFIEVLQINTPPIAFNRTRRGRNNEITTTVQIQITDREDDDIVAQFVLLPENGTLYKGAVAPGNEVTLETTFLESEPLFFYRPFNTSGLFYSELPLDKWAYTVSDDEFTVYAEEILFIDFVNLPPNPVGHLNEISLLEDTEKIFSLNSTDVNGSPTAIFYTFVTVPEVGQLFYADELVVAGVRLEPTFFNPETWEFTFIPPPNFNTFDPVSGQNVPLTFSYQVSDDFGDFWPETLVTEIFVEAVNDPPVIEGSSDPYRSYYVGFNTLAYPVVIPDIRIVDDAVIGQLTVNVTCFFSSLFVQQGNPSSLISGVYFLDASSLDSIQYTSNTSFVFNGTLVGINAAFASGLRVDPILGSQSQWPSNVTLRVFVSDNGEFGSGVGGATRTIYTDLRGFRLTFEEWTQLGAPENTGTPIVAMVGVTSLISMGFFGAYQVMKKKHIIPEEADPWENDAMFDATLDNPLYSTEPPALE